MPILILWIIWKIAEPQTTKMKRANNQGPTDAFSSGAFLEVLATLPRWVMFLLCFSLAIRIRCLATIFATLPPAQPPLGFARSLLLGPLRRSAPGARAAGARRFSGRALAPAAGPGRGERGGWTLAGRGPPTDWGRRPDRPSEAGAQEETRPPRYSSHRRRRWERGVKEDGNATPTSGPCSPSPRSTSGSAANVSTGQTPPRGSAGSAC